MSIGIFTYFASATIFGNITGSAVGRGFATIFTPLAIGGFFLLYSKIEKTNKCRIPAKLRWLPLSLGMVGLIYPESVVRPERVRHLAGGTPVR